MVVGVEVAQLYPAEELAKCDVTVVVRVAQVEVPGHLVLGVLSALSDKMILVDDVSRVCVIVWLLVRVRVRGIYHVVVGCCCGSRGQTKDDKSHTQGSECTQHHPVGHNFRRFESAKGPIGLETKHERTPRTRKNAVKARDMKGKTNHGTCAKNNSVTNRRAYGLLSTVRIKLRRLSTEIRRVQTGTERPA